MGSITIIHFLLILVFLFLMVMISFNDRCFAVAVRQSQTSSVIFPVTGNVYPDGYYHVTLSVGHHPKPYFVDMDTGSDLTWLQCDAPCVKCTPAPHSPYTPSRNIVTLDDPICKSQPWPDQRPSNNPKQQCDYEIEYTDNGSSVGVLLKDSFHLKLTDGSNLASEITFGCGYNQEFPDMLQPPFTDGVLGLGNGKASILSQFQSQGIIRNVIGHCLSGQGGGFLFFGDELVPASGIVWTSLSSKHTEKHYYLGPANLAFGGQSSNIKGLYVVFDSGSTYSYFNIEAYNTLVYLINKDLEGKDLKVDVEDSTLPVCWKSPKPFRSVRDVKKQFKPVALIFKKTQFEMQPESYLIITKLGNVCLGIMRGDEVGLKDTNLIGDISMQDKMIVYDNEKRRIGWIPSNCNKIPIVNNRNSCDARIHPYGGNMGLLEDQCPATYKQKKQGWDFFS